MTNSSELVFIPSPGAGHLPPTVEFAKVLLHREPQLSVTIIIMNLSREEKLSIETQKSTPRLRFIDIPEDKSTKDLISPHTFMSAFIEQQKPHVRNIVRSITESDSVRLVGFVVDMFCIDMMDIANELGTPTYLYFTSAAASLGLMFCLQAKRDNEGFDVTELKDTDPDLSLPSHAIPVPVKVLPSLLFDKGSGWPKTFLDLAKKYREPKGIIVNTFQELESHAIEYLASSNVTVPPVFPVGAILNREKKVNDDKFEEIMTWLNDQPDSSVVFLCFGSMGSFVENQVKEIAVAIEGSGQRFLWSLRRPPSKEKMEYPEEYEHFEEVLPEGFLDRTLSIGKVIGWAPQMAVLSHSSVGGFVSHCGWNSTLESIWCGVPVAAWPLYAEQQLNAFKLVVESGLAVEIKIDYRSNTMPGGGDEIIVTSKEIESGIRRLMNDEELRKKVKEMKGKSRFAVLEGGSSYVSIRRFIDLVLIKE
ncbi:UDP-glycosyltransferase 71E1-like [Rutidosis leptorrhynchoides]|uniref:UDP-glycosyltransferase 71E1-like n=1 Tax=Rutidosis leptorrhynchoides TaxID=125765 RepID=UPI003A99C3C0